MSTARCDSLSEFRRQIDFVLEALVFAGIFFFPYYTETLANAPFFAQAPYARIFFAAAWILWIVRKVAWCEKIPGSPALWLLAAFAAWTWNLLVVSPDPPRMGVEALRLSVESALLFAFASDFYQDAARRRRLILFFLGWMTLVCLSALWQVFSPAGRDFLAGRPIDVPGRSARMTGPFGSANSLAAFLLLALPLSVSEWISERRFSFKVFARIGLSALFAVCFVATLPRGAFLALWLTAFAWSLIFCRKALWGVAALPLAAGFFSPALRENFMSWTTAPDITAGFRIEAWRAAWPVLQNHPWAGVGPGGLGALLPQHPSEAGRLVPFAHNSYFQIAAETGWPGFFLFFAALVSAIVRRNHFDRPMEAAVRFGLTALAIHAFFDVHFQVFKIGALFWLFAGWLSPTSSASSSSLRTTPEWIRGVWLAGAAAATLFGVALPFLRPELQPFLLDRLPYWILWILAAAWAVCAARLLRTRLADEGLVRWGRQVLPACLLGLAAVTAVFWAVRPDLRVLSDEANLLMVSRSMAEWQRVDYVFEGWVRDGRLFPLVWTREIRPYLFPFLTHLFHRAGGYQAWHAFAVNFLALAGCVVLTFVLARRLTRSVLWAFAAVFALLCQPVTLLSSASAGFDVLQMLLVLASFAAAHFFLERPDEEARFRFLWLTLLLLAQARYESILFGALLIVFLTAFKRIPLSHFSRSWVYAATPLFLLPWAWQRIFHRNYRPPFFLADQPLYSWSYFWGHFGDFFSLLTDYSRFWPYNPLVFLLGLAGAAAVAVAVGRRRWLTDSNERILYGSFALATALISAGFCAYGESSLRLPSSARYVILGAMALGFLACVFLRFILGAQGGWAAVLLLGGSLFYFLPAAGDPRHWEKNLANFEYRFARKHRTMYGPPKEILWVVRRPVVFLARGDGAVSFWAARRAPRRFFERRLREGAKIWALQELRDGKVTGDTALPEGFRARKLAETGYGPRRSLQVVEVAGFSPLPPPKRFSSA